MRLLKHAFEGCSRVVVTKLHGGFSGSLVLETDSYGLDGSVKPTVTKLDDAKFVVEENARMLQFVNLFGGSAANVQWGPYLVNASGKPIEAGASSTEMDFGCVVLSMAFYKGLGDLKGQRPQKATLYDLLKKEAGKGADHLYEALNNARIDTVEKLMTFSIPEIELLGKTKLSVSEKDALTKLMDKLKQEHDLVSPEDEELSTIKAKTMYKMVEDVDDSKSGTKKLLFLSSKQADLIARDPTAIDKMLEIFLDKQQPRMVINLLPSMIRCWKRVRPPPGDPDNEREGLAALDRFMADHIIPLAEKTHAIILCSAIQPFCVLSESLSRMLKLVRSRWGSELPFTILSCTGQLPALYTVERPDATWRNIRNRSKTWKKREKEGQFAAAVTEKIDKNNKRNNKKGLKSPMKEDFDMDLDPNGTNFVIVDPTSSPAKYDSYNRLITEIVRQLNVELPSIAIQTGKSKFSYLEETNASGIEVALSNMKLGIPVLLLDLSKRPVTPATDTRGSGDGGSGEGGGEGGGDKGGGGNGGGGDGGGGEDGSGKGDGGGGIKVKKWFTPANKQALIVTPGGDEPAALRRQQIERHRAWVEKQPEALRRQQIEMHRAWVEEEEHSRRVNQKPDYDWDVCMISYFHDG